MSPRAFSHELRRQELVAATRQIFDATGTQQAGIEEIARIAGINRALIYKSFLSKDELFVMTANDYLGELREQLAESVAGERPAPDRLRAALSTYGRYCLRYPAFLDCQFSLMQKPAQELRANLSEPVWLQLGEMLSACLAAVAGVLADGAANATLRVTDPTLTANLLWSQLLGALHLARIGVVIGRDGGGPTLTAVSPQDVLAGCIANALAAVT